MASNWVTVDIGNPHWKFPDIEACYVVYCDGQLTYIGCAENLRKRFHCRFEYARYSATINTPWGGFLNVKVKYRPSRRFGDWAMIELRLIRRLQPKGNRKGIRRKLVADA